MEVTKEVGECMKDEDTILLRDEIKALGEKVERAFVERVRTEEQIKALRETVSIRIDTLSTSTIDQERRLRFLETKFWKYYGAGMVIAYILSVTTPYIIGLITS